MALQTGINDTTKISYVVEGFVNDRGEARPVDPTTPITRAEISDPSVARLVNQSPDLLSGEIERLSPGTFQLQVDVDADTGAGVKTFTLTSETVEIMPDFATGGVIKLAIG